MLSINLQLKVINKNFKIYLIILTQEIIGLNVFILLGIKEIEEAVGHLVFLKQLVIDFALHLIIVLILLHLHKI